MSQRSTGMLVLAGVAIVIFGITLFDVVSDGIRESRDRRYAQAVLSQAKSVNALKQVVGELGAVFELKDKSWVAIRYVDSHQGGIYSCAVALDSNGRWFHSRRHFCGRFAFYQEIGRMEETSPGRPNTHDPEVFALANAANVDEADAQLLRIGFSPMKPPLDLSEDSSSHP